MTAITTTQITGRVAYPDDTSASLGEIEFLLTGYDAEASADVTVVPRAVSAAIDANGDIDVNVWPNSAGLRGTQYQVTAVIPTPNGSSATRINLGRITVPDTGPADLNDLLSTAAVADTSGEILLPEQFGDTTVDSTNAINAMLAKSAQTGKLAMVFGPHNVSGSIAPGGAYNCHWGLAELTWIGSDVTVLNEIQHTPDGTVALEGSGKYAFFDAKGCNGAVNSGKLTIRGSSPGNMTAQARQNIPADLVGISTSEGNSADMIWQGLEIIGCGHDLWQGDMRGGGATVLPYTRWSGQLLQSQFCLQTFADGNSGNGFNEFRWQNIEIARPGGDFEIRSDFMGSTVFFKGPRFSTNTDVETPTISVTAGSTAATLSADILDGDSNSLIAAGDVINIEGVAANADGSNVLHHSTRIADKTGLSLTLETAPATTDAAARFILKPGGMRVIGATYEGELIYLEGQMAHGVLLRDGGKLSRKTVVEVSNGEFCGRYNAAVIVAGNVSTEVSATLHQRSGPANTNLECFVAVGTTASGSDYGDGVIDLSVQDPKVEFVKFPLIKGVKLESDHAASYTLNPGVPLGTRSYSARGPDGLQWYEVYTHGPASEARLDHASSYHTLGTNLRANEDATGLVDGGTCNAPSGGTAVKPAGGDGTWHEGVDTMAVGNKYLVEFTVDDTNALFDATTGEPGLAFQLFRSTGSGAGDPMLPNFGVPVRAAGAHRVHVTVPDGLLPNRVGFDCKAGTTATISRLVVRQVTDG